MSKETFKDTAHANTNTYKGRVKKGESSLSELASLSLDGEKGRAMRCLLPVEPSKVY